ncbi:MAG: hypothetical protein C0478_07210 [Planctomyces sp.]|nr:hypothetical protein [Planctomyces sp.]
MAKHLIMVIFIDRRESGVVAIIKPEGLDSTTFGITRSHDFKLHVSWLNLDHTDHSVIAHDETLVQAT